jgi:hypothetical protein
MVYYSNENYSIFHFAARYSGITFAAILNTANKQT